MEQSIKTILTWLALHFQSVKSVAEKFFEFLEKASISSKPLALACKGSHYRKSCVMSLAVKSKNSSPYFVFSLFQTNLPKSLLKGLNYQAVQ